MGCLSDAEGDEQTQSQTAEPPGQNQNQNQDQDQDQGATSDAGQESKQARKVQMRGASGEWRLGDVIAHPK